MTHIVYCDFNKLTNLKSQPLNLYQLLRELLTIVTTYCIKFISISIIFCIV